MNVYARTRLRSSLMADNLRAAVGDGIVVQVEAVTLRGNATVNRAFARMISPVTDIAALAAKLNPNKIDPDEMRRNESR